MTTTAGFIARPARDDRFTSNADFQTLERMIERHGLPAVLTEMVTLANMAAAEASQSSRRSRNRDRRANLDLRTELYAEASYALARAENAVSCAAAVDIS